MKRIYVIGLFLLLTAAQIFVPGQMIWKHENVLSSGNMFKFKTQPIDPTDPFRGKYITLNFELNSYTSFDNKFTYGDRVYVYLYKDEEGFAIADTVSKESLKNGKDYVVAEVTSNYNGKVNFSLPFDRFYMEEDKAPKAEKVYTELNRVDSLNSALVYAKVYIKDGLGVLEDVMIDEVSIKDYIKR